MNPFDEIAVEEAVRMKEKKLVKEIVVVRATGALYTMFSVHYSFIVLYMFSVHCTQVLL